VVGGNPARMLGYFLVTLCGRTAPISLECAPRGEIQIRQDAQPVTGRALVVAAWVSSDPKGLWDKPREE